MKADPAGDAVIVSDLAVGYAAHGASPAFEALHGISLRVHAGEVLGLLGESGSGKSTLARVLAGLHLTTGSKVGRPVITGGDATVAGFGLRHLPTRALPRFTFAVGYLAQDAGAALRPDLRVSELVAEPIFARDRRYDRTDAATRVATMLDAVHLPLLALDKFPYELSSGQRQRVALARSLVLGPSVLVADEPTSGIDVTVRDAVVDLIAGLRAEREFTAIVISHDTAVLSRAADRIAVLHEGALVALGDAASVFDDPFHPYVRRLAEALEYPADDPTTR